MDCGSNSLYALHIHIYSVYIDYKHLFRIFLINFQNIQANDIQPNDIQPKKSL